MIFSSFIYILIFFPITLLLTEYLVHRFSARTAVAFLTFTSLIFYTYWKPSFLPVIIISIIVNFSLIQLLLHTKGTSKKITAGIAIIFNIGYLGVFKYTDFLIQNFNILFSTNLPLIGIALPLGISFFTFQQLAFAIDCHKAPPKSFSLKNYFLFITFFPQLIAGPIVQHQEMTSQYDKLCLPKVRWKNYYLGLAFFSIGLFKKVVLADTFSVWIAPGFAAPEQLSFFGAWATSIGYSLQLYFDFSGYADMAIGSAKFFNISIPFNFDAPYRSKSISDFWRRWHITLGRFLHHYLYIPLGGNRCTHSRQYYNLLVTFLLAGLWHGAGWTFIIWGMLHGLAMATQRLWKRLNISINGYLSWILTILFVNFAWVFFRAESIEKATRIIETMLGKHGITAYSFLHSVSWLVPSAKIIPTPLWGAVTLGSATFVLLSSTIYLIWGDVKNDYPFFKPSLFSSALILFMLLSSSLAMLQKSRISEFIYFAF